MMLPEKLADTIGKKLGIPETGITIVVLWVAIIIPTQKPIYPQPHSLPSTTS